MINQGGTTDTLTTLDPNSIEKQQVVNSSQPYTSSYYAPPPGSVAASWTMHGAANSLRENGGLSNPSYNNDQRPELTTRNVQDGLNVASVASTSGSGAVNVTQDYSNYASYPSNDQYGYNNNTGYAAYYSGYQQQSNQSYSQPVGAYQNTGAPYQPISSFQNSGSYGGPASYSSTYYNPADYQTSGGYQSGAYSNQNNTWHEGQYGTYSSHQYPSYNADTNTAYNSTTAASTSQYQQQYNQWANYYSQTQTEVSCAPGTENIPVSSASSLSCPIPSVPGGYPASSSQSSVSYSSAWRPDSISSELPSVQPVAASGSVQEGYWKYGQSVYQHYTPTSVQPHVQQPFDSHPTYGNFQNQQNSSLPQGPSTPLATSNHVSNYQPSSPAVTQTASPSDSRRVSKLQIPTNPRIASNVALSLPKTGKEISASTVPVKPAYISVSVPKANDKVSSGDAADSVLKPGMFPKALRGYVERALARCKDDAQMLACQTVMKEIITKATADGTLYTRDWDIEPLFPLPEADSVNKEPLLFSTPVTSFPKSRSPTRRSKSRWEPVAEEKVVEKPVTMSHANVKFGGWNKQLSSGGQLDNNEGNVNSMKFSFPDHKSSNKNVQRPAKRQRLGDTMNIDNGGASSDSDKEQSLTAYFSAAQALADSPEEKKRRESRSKRFEKKQGNRSGKNHFRPKNVGPGNLYARRATALVMSRNFDDGGSRAVEDIDWDSLTVKGTCQEVEKRYLRLTSAPDPATVRPEDVLEKALLMVQNSQKTYLYKCDQLKSIRQDLTVQRIRNELTVKVYETHARLAIEFGDLPEYNQCQSQLITLYAEGIGGCYMEFAAYNLLCVILHSNNNRDLVAAMSRLSAEAKKDEAVKHALAVRKAVTSGNYVLFFRLYKAAPNLNTCLMDLYVEKMRYAAVKCMSRSYRPTIPVSYIADVLGFSGVSPTTEATDEKDIDGAEECIEWLKAHGACLTSDNSGEMLFDTKASTSTLYMPEPEDAVAHGDANLAVNDFFTRNPV